MELLLSSKESQKFLEPSFAARELQYCVGVVVREFQYVRTAVCGHNNVWASWCVLVSQRVAVVVLGSCNAWAFVVRGSLSTWEVQRVGRVSQFRYRI